MHPLTTPLCSRLGVELPIVQADLLSVCIEEQVPILSTFWGDRLRWPRAHVSRASSTCTPSAPRPRPRRPAPPASTPWLSRGGKRAGTSVATSQRWRWSRPGENTVVATDAHGGPRRRYHQAMPTVGATGDVEDMALYAGQAVALSHEVMPAAQIVAEFAAEAADILGRRFPRSDGRR